MSNNSNVVFTTDDYIAAAELLATCTNKQFEFLKKVLNKAGMMSDVEKTVEQMKGAGQ